MAEKADAILTEEERADSSRNGGEPLEGESTPLFETDELGGLIAEGRERGYLTFEEISAKLEEVDVTKEQVRDLHTYLIDNGGDVIGVRRMTKAKSEAERANAGKSQFIAAAKHVIGVRGVPVGPGMRAPLRPLTPGEATALDAAVATFLPAGSSAQV